MNEYEIMAQEPQDVEMLVDVVGAVVRGVWYFAARSIAMMPPVVQSDMEYFSCVSSNCSIDVSIVPSRLLLAHTFV